ncbi:MAG: bacillithiol biosynthesis BshC [Bacteroidota bacterium]
MSSGRYILLSQPYFRGNGLQERYDNALYYYARWGQEFIQKLYEHSLTLEQEFVIMVSDQ